MNPITRRSSLVHLATGAALFLTIDRSARAATGPKVDEADPVAVSLGYRDDTKKVDEKKYPKHAATQACNNCQLFQGTPKDALGGCPLFAGKQVAGPGWCSAWAKKA